MKVFRHGIALALMGLACTTAIAQDTRIRGKETPAQKRADRAEARADRHTTDADAELKQEVLERIGPLIAGRIIAAREESKQDDKAIAEYFAGKLMLMDQSTIQLAQLAEERSTNEKVKQFARMLAEEHTKCSEMLRESAPGVVGVTELQSAEITQVAGFRGPTDADEKTDAVVRPAKGERNPARKPDDAEQLTGNDPADKDHADDSKHHRAAHTMTPLHRILSIDRQATENYVQSTTEMLNKYQGQEFDMGFLGFTIGSHTWALAELKAMDSVGDEKFRKLISDATTKVEQHMMKAEELSKELGADSAQNRNTTRPTTSNENAPAPEK